MKEITAVRYSLLDNSQVEITFDDASIYTQPHNEFRYQYTDQLNYWLEGKSLAWVENDTAYKLYQDLITYEQRLADWEACTPVEPDYDNCGSKPQVPQSFTYNDVYYYYATQEQVDDSQAKWNEWSACMGGPEPELCGNEPEVLLRPDAFPPVPAPVPAEEDLTPNEITPYDKYYGMTLDEVKEINQNAVDADCKEYIYQYWSNEAQANASMGLYDEQTTSLCKDEISAVLSENKTFIDTIAGLTSNEEIDNYVESITRTTITGGR